MASIIECRYMRSLFILLYACVSIRVRVCASVSWVHVCGCMLACVNVYVYCVYVITRACVYRLHYICVWKYLYPKAGVLWVFPLCIGAECVCRVCTCVCVCMCVVLVRACLCLIYL